jgi:hypothetical protein
MNYEDVQRGGDMSGQRSSSGGSMAGCDMNESIYSPSTRDDSPMRATNGLIVFSWGRGEFLSYRLSVRFGLFCILSHVGDDDDDVSDSNI